LFKADGDKTGTPQANVIVFNPEYALDLLSNEKLSLAISKRFKGRFTRYESLGYQELVCWCLATDGYKLSEEGFFSVSNEDVEGAWNFIDSVRVSSSNDCRDLVNRGALSRDGTGFGRTHIPEEPGGGTYRRNTGIPEDPPLVGLLKDEPYISIEEALVSDCMYWVKRSDDPCALLMQRNISKTNQGLNKSLVHTRRVCHDYTVS
jgi:hypothetical protein